MIMERKVGKLLSEQINYKIHQVKYLFSKSGFDYEMEGIKD